MTTPFVLAALVVVAMALPVSAQPYAARRSGDVMELEDTRSQTTVSIVPSVGNIAFSMKVKGHDVLRWPYASVEDFKARPGLSGIPFLAPWANRLDEQAFYANGKRYAFDMELGNVRGAIPIHGYTTTNDQWQVEEVKSDATSAWVKSKLEFFRQPMWMKQFPFAHTIEMTHRLRDGVLEVQTTITSLSAEPMPVSVGFHPYFRLTDSPREEWTFSVPAKTRWVLPGTKAPDGRTEPADVLLPGGGPQPLKDYNLDDVFSDLVRDAQGRAHFVVKGKQQQLDVMFGPNWRAGTVWSPSPSGTGKGSNAIVNPDAPARAAAPPAGNAASAGRGGAAGRGAAGRGGAPPADPNFICFEPMAGISNAMNLAQRGLYKDLQYLPPGGTWQESFWVQPSGF